VATAPTASPAAALSPGSAASTTLPAAEAGDRVAAGSVGAPASGASGVPAIAAVTAPVERPATPRDLATKRAIAARDSRGRETRPASSSTPVAPPPTGLVLLAISPWGAVEVDGRAVGTSPPLTELRLAQGRHQIVIRNTDLLPHIAHVDVTADQPVTLKHRF
jgi:serine/threonine-protein kinase